MTRRLQDLVERIDVVLPEVAARVAALEHLLLELKICTQEDLRSAREFVRIQEA
jgi:Holliday junction resolvasome RuvABC endonuclease subunit